MARASLLPALLRLLIVLLAGSSVNPAAAQGPTATATLSQAECGVGDEVELKVKIRGASQIRWQGNVVVDGLEIRGPRMESALGFGGFGALGEGMTMTFAVVPQRPGQFTIPPIVMNADGRAVRTEPLPLTVKAGLQAQPSKTADAAAGVLEIIVPKKTLYVGETIPVEVRLSVDSAIRWQPEAMPEITGEGFTKQKFPEPKQQQGTRDGREVDQLIFRTAITPTKPGTITLGPVEIPYIAQVPRAKRQNRSRSLFDLFDDSIFGDPFFAENRRFKARAEAVQIEVKSLPATGRPDSFSGAIGKFKFDASGSPGEVKVGDPVTMSLSVSGQGNFERIGAPALADATGWRSYPPSSNFKANDELNLTGTKTFTMAVIPEQQQTRMPAFEFSYFDPDKAKYVTLKGETAPLKVTGAPVAPPPEPVPAPRAPAAPATPAPAAAPADILGLRYDPGSSRRSFEPIYRERAFLLAQLVPLAALALLLGSRLRRSDEEGKARAKWRREKTAALGRLRGRTLSDAEFLETAAQVVQLATAETTGRPAGSVDAAFAMASRRLDAETSAGIERLFAARAELLYAGMNGGREPLTSEQRRALLAAVERFDQAHE